MKYFAGLDVSLEETEICIVDESGRIVKEARAASEPGALGEALREVDVPLERIGLEACSLPQSVGHDHRQAPGHGAGACGGGPQLAVILHRMWADATEFRFGREPAALAA